MNPYYDYDEKDLYTIAAMQRWGGGFVQALAEAARRADAENLRRIKTAWPEYWRDYGAMSDAQNDEN